LKLLYGSRSGQKEGTGEFRGMKIGVFVQIFGKVTVGMNFLNHAIGYFVKLSMSYGENCVF